MKYKFITLIYCFVFALCLNFNLKADNSVGDEKYFTANSLYNKKLFKLAAEEYRNFLIRYPEHPKVNNAKFGLALSFYELREYKNAKNIFSELASKEDMPYQDQIHNLLGQCYLVDNNPSQAEAAFRWSVNNGKEKLYLDLPGVSQGNEESPQVSMGDIQSLEPLERSLAGLIEALFQQKKWNEVVNTKNELNKLVPQSKYTGRAGFLAALACYQLKQYAKAEKILNTILRDGDKLPFYEHALFLLAECQQLQGKLDLSGKNHEIIVKKIKGDFSDNSLFRLGYINYLQKKYHLAIRDFSDLRTVYGDSPYTSESGIYLGKSYLQLKEYLKAQSVLGSLMDDKKVAADAHLWLGRVFIEQKDYTKAIDVLTRGTKLYKNNPLNSKMIFELANANMLNNNFVEAGSFFKELNKKYPEDTLNEDTLKFQAYSYNRAKLYEKSIVACTAFLKKYPESKQAVDISFLNAENLFFLNKINKAIYEFNKFIPIQGKGKYTNEAIYRLAQCYLDKKDWKSVLTNSEMLIKDKDELEGDFYNQLYYLAGVSSYQLDDWKDAISYLKEFIGYGGNEEIHDSALMKLGVSYIKVKEFNDADKVLNTLLKKYPSSKFYPYALNEIGKIKFLQNKYDVAEECFNKILTYYPKTEFVKQAEYYLGWISLKRKNSSDATKYFKSISKKYPNSDLAANSLLQLSINQLESGEFENAEASFNKFITIYPNNPAREEAVYYLYYTRSLDKKNDKIDDIFKPFITKYPKSSFAPSAIYESAWRARRLGKVDLAIKYYRDFLKKYPSNKLNNKVTLELAETMYNNKKYDDAIELLDKLKVVGVDKKLEPQVLYRLAWCLIGREQNNSAMKYFKELIQKYPESEFTQTSAYQIGEIYLKEKDFDKGYKYFETAFNAKGKDLNLSEQVMLRLGETQALTDRWTASQKTFAEFIKEYGSSKYLDRAYMWLGWTQENQRDYTRAIKNYSKAILLADKSEIAARSQFQIGECYYALGKYEQALKEFIKVELSYSYPEWISKALLEMSQVLESMGKRIRAQDILEKLIKKYPGTDEAISASELLDKSRSYLIE